MELKDLYKDLAYIVIGLTAYVIKYYKDKRNAKKNNEDLRLEMAQVAQRIAEEQRSKAEEQSARLKEELAEAALKLAEETARQQAREKAAQAEKSGIEINERIDREIRHAIIKIRNEYHFQRAYVVHFSNGVVTEAGIHLMKITLKSEVLERYDVEPVAKYFNEAPIPEMFKSPMTLVLAGAEYYLKDIETIQRTDPARADYYDWLCAYKVRSTLWVPIRSRSGKIVAILVLHWFATTQWSPSELAKIKDMKREIEGIYHTLQKGH
jgi:hypothetical protein